jgi:hypothetical protein
MGIPRACYRWKEEPTARRIARFALLVLRTENGQRLSSPTER